MCFLKATEIERERERESNKYFNRGGFSEGGSDSRWWRHGGALNRLAPSVALPRGQSLDESLRRLTS